MKISTLFLLFLCLTLTTLPQRNMPASALDSYNEAPSRLRGVIDKFEQDYGALNRWYSAPFSTNRAERMSRLYSDELAFLAGLNFDSLNHDEQVDYILFKNHLDREQKELVRSQGQLSEMTTLVPFARTVSDLEDARRRMETVDSAKTAATLNQLT